MIYTLYASKDHPIVDILKFLLTLFVGFMCVGLGVGLAEELFDNELIILLIGGGAGLTLFIVLLSIFDNLLDKFTSKREKEAKR